MGGEEGTVNIYWEIYGSNNLLRICQEFSQPSKPLHKTGTIFFCYFIEDEMKTW